ncbi:MAG TPA: FtsX-like permease family protein [Vicinamibacterales bacterium]|jgi:lipoprotein-releasing system permease protein|nr:FtsX-like permease family protein [Vicinamibacterales bacterium]
MDLPFELFVALRYLLARRKQAFISLISFVSTLGVAVGVMALIVALALMNGLQSEMRDRILGSTPHVYVAKAGGLSDYHEEIRKLESIDGVVGAAPMILGGGLIDSSVERAFVTLKGIDPDVEAKVTDLPRAMVSGRISDLAPVEGKSDGIIIGKDLSDRIGAFVGDQVQVLTSAETLTPMGMLPRARVLRVVGIFKLGLYEFDSSYGFISLPVAERLLGRERPDYIQLRVRDIYRAPAIAESIPERLGGIYTAQDWSDMNQSLFSALWLEKMAISITIGLIVMVAALNIVASLVLLVMEKNRDIAILKTMGSSAASVRKIFMLQGLVIGLIGTAVGAAGGLGLSYLADRYRLVRLPMDVYQISHVPFRIEPFDFTVVVVSAIVICFAATIYPSGHAARLDPAQALRYS